MKTHSIRRARGFTLVELLVVITIIMVLAAAGFAAGTAAITKARKVTSQSTATGIETAISSFYSDNASLPYTGSSATAISSNSAEGLAILNALLGVETSANPLNPKNVRYLNVKQGKGNKDGIIYDAAGTVTGLYDAWGNPFFIVLDVNYADSFADPLKAGNTIRGKKAVVYSAGADKITPSNDDVKTW